MQPYTARYNAAAHTALRAAYNDRNDAALLAWLHKSDTLGGASRASATPNAAVAEALEATAHDRLHFAGIAAYYTRDTALARALLRTLLRAVPDTAAYWRRNAPNLLHLLRHDFVAAPAHGRIRVRDGKQYGYLDSLGRMAIAPRYEAAEDFGPDGLATVRLNGKAWTIDRSGTVTGAALELTPARDPKTGLWGYQDATGGWQIAAQYQQAMPMQQRRARVQQPGKAGLWGWIDARGNPLIAPRFADAHDFVEGLAAVKIDTAWGYVDEAGTLRIAAKYRAAADFSGGLAEVQEGTMTYEIDPEGNCSGSLYSCPMDRLDGIVTDGTTGKPIGRATLTAYGRTATAKADGSFALTLPRKVQAVTIPLTIAAPGYQPATLSVRTGTQIEVKLTPEKTNQVTPTPTKDAAGPAQSIDLKAVLDEIASNMVSIQGGTFKMGSQEYEEAKPIHNVTVSSFLMSSTEVTQAQWQAVMGNNPSRFNDCPTCPVEKVSWDDTQEFLIKLNQLTAPSRASGAAGYRLPTEAEWEYAAGGGAGSRTIYAGTNPSLNDYAWYKSNSDKKTHPVKTKLPNALGLYDMSGNVWEWCQDWYSATYYKKIPSTNPVNSTSATYYVLRGGSWGNDDLDCRVFNRGRSNPSSRTYGIGFRLVR
jgi:formylglycine-generating enzyme required for sulfatase activity